MSENISFDELCNKPNKIASDFAFKSMPNKASFSPLKAFVLAIAAGAFIAFGAQGSLIAATGADVMGLGLAKLLGGIVFSTGLMLIVFSGAELFTGNALIGISVLEKKVSIWALLKNWILVYLGNFVGALIVAFLIANTTMYHGGYDATGIVGLKTAINKTNLTFGQAFCSGILCNWLVCMAVWMACAARDVVGKIFAILFPIATFAMSGYEHCVANMFMVSNGLFIKNGGNEAILSLFNNLDTLTIKTFLVDNLIPVTLGNIIGALIFVVGLFWVVYLKEKNN